MSILPPLLCLALTIFGVREYSRHPESWSAFATLSYTMIMFGGIIAVCFLEALFDLSISSPELTLLLLEAIIGLVALRIGIRLHFKMRKRVPRFSGEWMNVERAVDTKPVVSLQSAPALSLFVLATITVSLIFLFGVINGFSVAQHSYVHRYEVSRGWGPVIAFFPAFLPAGALLMSKSKSITQFVLFSLITIFVGFLTYVVLVGYRQILMGSILTTVAVASKKGYLKVWVLPALMVLGIILSVGLSVFRYSYEATSPSTFSSTATLNYLQGDFFPIIAPLHINEELSDYNPPGWSAFANTFLLFIPRYFWPGKPNIMLNPAGYYTQEIIGYSRAVTLSPTILGEALLVGGWLMIPLFLFLAGWLVATIDSLLVSTRLSIIYYNLIAAQYQCFFLMREGLSVFLARIFFVMGFIVICYMIVQLLPGQRKRRFSW